MKAWSWMAYPLVVVIVILISTNVLFGNIGLWDKLSARQAQLKQQTEMATQLRTKLSKLQSANLSVEHQNLNYLISVLPSNKNLAVLLSQIGQAASASGAIFEGFRGNVGEVAASQSAKSSDSLELEVTLQVTDISQLQHTLAALETSLPLVKVSQVRLSLGRANLTVEAVWNYLAKLPNGTQYDVPDIASSLTAVRDQLKNYSALPKSEIPIDTGVNLAPFQ